MLQIVYALFADETRTYSLLPGCGTPCRTVNHHSDRRKSCRATHIARQLSARIIRAPTVKHGNKTRSWFGEPMPLCKISATNLGGALRDDNGGAQTHSTSSSDGETHTTVVNLFRNCAHSRVRASGRSEPHSTHIIFVCNQLEIKRRRAEVVCPHRKYA